MGEAYVELMSRMKEIETVGQIQGLLGWDQEVMMPPKAAPLRACLLYTSPSPRD